MKLHENQWRVVAVGSTRARNSKKPSCEKEPGNAFTLTVASHCVAATREVDPRHSTRDLRLEQRPPKNLCVLCERKTLKLLREAHTIEA